MTAIEREGSFYLLVLLVHVMGFTCASKKAGRCLHLLQIFLCTHENKKWMIHDKVEIDVHSKRALCVGIS